MLKVRATSKGECGSSAKGRMENPPKIAVRGAPCNEGFVARRERLFTPPKKSGASFEFNSTNSQLHASY
jgi:hypothetical protein